MTDQRQSPVDALLDLVVCAVVCVVVGGWLTHACLGAP